MGVSKDMGIESHEQSSGKIAALQTEYVERKAVRYDSPDFQEKSFQERLGKQAELLRPYLRFFLSTWLNEDYAYRVYFTRRCFNMNEILFTLRTLPYSDWGYDEREIAALMKARTTFLSQNALFGYVGKMIDTYENSGIFPHILVVDELIIYGRQITAFMRDMENAIVHEWRQKHDGQQGGQTERKLRRDFLQAVDVRIYAQDDHAPLEERYFARIQSKNPMQRAEWRDMILKMAVGLTRSDLVENASYAPFFRLSLNDYELLKKALNKDGWKSRKWTYHCLEAEIWQNRQIAFLNKIMLQGTFRVHRDELSNTVRIVPLALFEKISTANLNDVSEALAVFFAEQDSKMFDHIIRLLRSKCPIMQKVKMQWISFLLSVIMFFGAMERAGIAFALSDVDNNGISKNRNHDLDKITKNFALFNDAFDAVRALCSPDENAQSRRNKLWKNLLYPKLKDTLTLLSVPENGNSVSKKSASDYIRLAEDFFFETGARDEEYLSVIKRQGLTYRVIVPTNIRSSMGSYLKYFREHSEGTVYAVEDCIGILLMIMDTGVTAMTIRDDKNESGDACLSNWVRSGEQALYARARRYYRFFPALVELESRCERSGYNIVRQMRRFGEALERMEPDQKNLGSGFSKLYTDLRKQGYKMRDWNIDFLLDLDIPTQNGDDATDDVRPVQDWNDKSWEEREWKKFRRCAGNHRKFEVYERKIQLSYVRLAQDFSLSD